MRIHRLVLMCFLLGINIVGVFLSSVYADEIKVNAKAITQAHNERREKYHSPPLVYSIALQRTAIKWAKKLQSNACRMSHSHGVSGENLYWASPKIKITTNSKGNKTRINSLQNISEQQVVGAWYKEVKWYDYATNSCQQGQVCGHYTQVIWKTTRELGCAAIACEDDSQVWVCEYAPAGNINMRYQDGSVKKLKPY